MAVSEKYGNRENLERIKKNIRDWYQYSKKNYDRFHKFRKYVFDTSLTDDQKASLKSRGIPEVEFNITEAYISRLVGEFSKHEPSISVTPAEGTPIDSQVIDFVDGHIRHLFYEADKNGFSNEVYKCTLSGGFDVAKVYTDYASPMSFDKIIKVDRAFDPTLCGFDPMARSPSKDDGQFSFELYPLLKEDFIRRYPDVDISQVGFNRGIEGFNWSYVSDSEAKILLMGEYFEKKKRKVKIVKLANGKVLSEKNYQKFVQWWRDQGFIAQHPMPVGKPRMTEIETICRYLLIESEIFSYEELDYSYLPHVWIDGNSIILTEGTSNNTFQMTRPYVYHAMGMQDLKNFGGQSLANFLENIVQHKFIIKQEALPQEQEYLDAINDIQHANTLVVRAFDENNPDKAIPEPIREVMTPGAPPEIMASFSQTDQMMQMVLGTFDAALGINDNQLSGVAIVEGATQSNAAAMPYAMGYLQGLTHIANIIVDLIPKTIKNERTAPVRSKEGKKLYQQVNGETTPGMAPQSPQLDYDQNSLNVEITAGVNFAIAKNKALQQIVAMMQASPTFAEFMSSEGMPTLLDNMEFYNSDIVKEKAEKWLEQRKQQAAQQPPQPSPVELKMQEIQGKMKYQQGQLQLQSMETQAKIQKDQMQLQVDQAKVQADKLKIAADLKISQDENMRELVRHSHTQDMEVHNQILKHVDQEHKHRHDEHESIRKSVSLHHQLSKPEESKKNE